MDPGILLWAARTGAFLPAVVSLWLLVRLWQESELFGKAAVVCGCWWLVAIVTQVFASESLPWLAGLLAQVALAILLVLKQQISDIK